MFTTSKNKRTPRWS